MDGTEYGSLVTEKDKKTIVLKDCGDEIGINKKRHIFMPANLPEYHIAFSYGDEIVVFKEMRNFHDAIEVRGENLEFKEVGEDGSFELIKDSTVICKGHTFPENCYRDKR